MEVRIAWRGQWYGLDLSAAEDLSLFFHTGAGSARAWYCPPVQMNPVVMGSFIGSVAKGGSVNFQNVQFNPHGNGTHTECVGHISVEAHQVLDCVRGLQGMARLCTILPQAMDGDLVLTLAEVQPILAEFQGERHLIVRTLPNTAAKREQHYTQCNPPYFTLEAMQAIVAAGVEHLLVDLPSVDREEDGGALAGHHCFWAHPQATASRLHCSITELIYVPDEIPDGWYWLDIQVSPFALDASPSRPLLYALKTV